MADKVIQITVTLPEDSSMNRAEWIGKTIAIYIANGFFEIDKNKISWYVELLKDQDTS